MEVIYNTLLTGISSDQLQDVSFSILQHSSLLGPFQSLGTQYAEVK